MSEADQSMRLVEHDQAWSTEFERIAREVREMLGASVVAVHHIGSTAIPAVAWAKPVIDVLVEVNRLQHADRNTDRLTRDGFEPRGEYGIIGRRYYVRPARAARSRVHLHIYPAGHDQVDRHLAFRDYIRAHPDVAEGYSMLKRRLADVHASDKGSYQAGKADFIARTEGLATQSQWRSDR